MRTAAAFTGLDAEIVVFESDRCFIASSTRPNMAMAPRHMNDAERILVDRGDGSSESATCDGVISAPILDEAGHLVAALSLLDSDSVGLSSTMSSCTIGLEALVRQIRAELDSSNTTDPDFFRTLVHGQRDAVIVLTADLSVRWVSSGIVSLLGRSPSDFIGHSAADFLHPDDIEATVDAIAKFTEGLAMYRVTVRVADGHGDYSPIEVTGSDLSTDPTIGGMVLNLRDANYESERDVEIDRSRRLSEAIVGSLRDGLVATDRFGSITMVNDVGRAMFEIPSDKAPAQLSLDRFSLVTLDGRPYDPLARPGAVARCILPGTNAVRYFSCLTQAVTAADGDEMGYVLVYSDVTEEHRAATELRTQALHDHLTGLPNRRQLDERLALLDAKATRSGVAACFIDLDGFKLVNDNHGHRHGDQLLRVAADRLALELREDDLLVRHGGDEFVVLLSNVDDIDSARRTAERYRSVLLDPFDIARERFDLTASIGVAFSPSGDSTLDVLLSHADIALHVAKESGRNQVVSFDDGLADAVATEESQRRLLREALDGDRVVMHFQPLIDAGTELTQGYEALARIETLEGGLLSPASFLDAVANTGLMWELDQRAFELSCRAASVLACLDTTAAPYIACNFSPVSLGRPDFAEFVLATIAETGVEPSQLRIELTETAAFTAGAQRDATLRSLCEHGIRLALDDFGTGYSSLAHLRDLPISTVKVDRSFIARLTDRESERSITEAVVALARDLDLDVVAEGVETAEQLELAREIGIDTIQGWHFSPALPLDKCVENWRTTIDATRTT